MNATSSFETGQAGQSDPSDLRQPTPIKDAYEKQKKLHCEIHSHPYAKRTAGRVATTSASQDDRINPA